MALIAGMAVGLAITPIGQAQDESITVESLLESGQEWLDENVDAQVLEALGPIDPEPLTPLLQELQRRLQGEYVVDLARFRASATNLISQLEEQAETRPYADWLRARLDYFEVAEAFRLTIPPPVTEPGEPVAPVPNPAPEVERKAWQKQVSKRPIPTGAQEYAARFKPVFTAQQVPQELVWLAEVESGFNPTARSPAGAAGLYQLMPATAKSLGLTLKPKDERLDPDRNAEAAAKYLRALYPKFKDWRLALAAYNAGEGRIQRLLKRHKATEFDQIAQHLPAETQFYVPKVEAVVLKREGVSLASLKAGGG